jgi:hypothetical protein
MEFCVVLVRSQTPCFGFPGVGEDLVLSGFRISDPLFLGKSHEPLFLTDADFAKQAVHVNPE